MRSHQIHRWNFVGVVHGVALTSWAMGRNGGAAYPATIALAATSRVTTLPAPIRAFSPIVTLARMVAPDPMEAPFFTTVGSTFQSFSFCNCPFDVVARG